jgi:hypothetical protein
MKSPQGQRLKAEMMIRTSENLIEQVVLKSNQIPPEQIGWKMVMSLALHECTQTIQQNEKTINLIQQSSVNETF